MKTTAVAPVLVLCTWALPGVPLRALAQVASLAADCGHDAGTSTDASETVQHKDYFDAVPPAPSAARDAPQCFDIMPVAATGYHLTPAREAARQGPGVHPGDLLAWLAWHDLPYVRADNTNKPRRRARPFDEDCNSNGVPDRYDLAAGTSHDCNSNAVADECERDCNCNGHPDDCDIVLGTSRDVNFDGYPDECAEAPLADVTEQQDHPLWGPRYSDSGWDGQEGPPISEILGWEVPFDQPFNIRGPSSQPPSIEEVSPYASLDTSSSHPTPPPDYRMPGRKPKTTSTPEPSALVLLAVGVIIVASRGRARAAGGASIRS